MVMTVEHRAELIADFIEAVGDKYSPLHYDKRLFGAIKAFNDTYSERRVHGFSEAWREAYISGVTVLLQVDAA